MSTGLRFTLEVDGLPPDAFAVVSFHLNQSLSSLFSLDLSLVSQQFLSLEFAQVLDKMAYLTIWQGDEVQRRVKGVVTWFELGENDKNQMLYSMKVHPPLWRAGLRQNFRIFQNEDIKSILGTMLQENGVTEWSPLFSEPHPSREFCVQYGETDYDFLCRMAAEEGIFFYEEHAQKSTDQSLVLCDTVRYLPESFEIPWNPNTRTEVSTLCISQFRYSAQIRPSSVVTKDYTFKRPGWAGRFEQEGQHQDYLDIQPEFPPWQRMILGGITIASYLLPPAGLLGKLGNLAKLGKLGNLLGKSGKLLGAKLGALLGKTGKSLKSIANKVIRWVTDPVDPVQWQQHHKLSGLERAETDAEGFRYDRHGNLLAYTDGNGVVWTMEYGPFDLPVARTDGEGHRWQYRYDKDTLQLTEVINPQGESYLYVLDNCGRVTEEHDWGGVVWRYRYDADGLCTARVNGLEETILYSRDAAGRLAEIITPEGKTQYAYDKSGRLTGIFSPDGTSQRTGYDERGRVNVTTQGRRAIEYHYPDEHTVK